MLITHTYAGNASINFKPVTVVRGGSRNFERMFQVLDLKLQLHFSLQPNCKLKTKKKCTAVLRYNNYIQGLKILDFRPQGSK